MLSWMKDDFNVRKLQSYRQSFLKGWESIPCFQVVGNPAIVSRFSTPWKQEIDCKSCPFQFNRANRKPVILAVHFNESFKKQLQPLFYAFTYIFGCVMVCLLKHLNKCFSICEGILLMNYLSLTS